MQEQKHPNQVAEGKSLVTRIPSISRPTMAAVSASGSGIATTGAVSASSNANASDSQEPCSGQEHRPVVPVNVNTYVSKNEIQQAEIVWSLKVMSSHYSYYSSEATADPFKSM